MKRLFMGHKDKVKVLEKKKKVVKTGNKHVPVTTTYTVKISEVDPATGKTTHVKTETRNPMTGKWE